MNYNEVPKCEHSSLKEAMDELLEKESFLQKSIINSLSFLCIFIGINHLITSFHVYTPNYYCQESNFSACDPQCPSVVFDGDDSTIVTEWNLVCDRRYLSAMVNTLYFVGVTFGATLGGILADKFGRMPVGFICLYVQAVLGVALYFVNNLVLFIVIRVVQGFLIQAMGSATFAMLSEYCSRNLRTYMSVIWQIWFSLSLVYLAFVDYFIGDWRWLEVIVSVPCLLTLPMVWTTPESPRWLLSKSKSEKALRVCKKLDKSFPAIKENCEASEESSEKRPQVGYFDLFKNSILRKHLLINCTTFFAVSFSNYGIFYFLSDVVGNRHLNYVISAFIEMFFTLITFFVLKRFGRVYPMAFFQCSPSIFLIILGFLSQFTSDQLWAGITISVMAQIGRGLTVGGYTTVRVQAAETFPTICRGNGFGISSSFARIGSLFAPQMILLEEVSNTITAMLIYSASLIAGGIGCLCLPETNNKQLPNTLEEAEQVWGKKQKPAGFVLNAF